MNANDDDIEELEGPFEQIAGASLTGGSDGSCCSVSLSLPFAVCSDKHIQGTATATGPNSDGSTVYVIQPDDTVVQDTKTVTVDFIPRDKDAGTTVKFQAGASCACGDVVTWNVDVVKATLKTFTILGTDVIWENGKLGARIYLFASVKVSPPNNRSKISVQIVQTVASIVGINRGRLGDPTFIPDRKVDTEFKPDAPINGSDETIVIEGGDFPGFIPVIVDANTPHLLELYMDAIFWTYLQVKCDSGDWHTLGKAEWRMTVEGEWTPTGADPTIKRGGIDPKNAYGKETDKQPELPPAPPQP